MYIYIYMILCIVFVIGHYILSILGKNDQKILCPHLVPKTGGSLHGTHHILGRFHRGSEVISMLEGLQDKFVDERVTLEKEEAKKRHSYDAW